MKTKTIILSLIIATAVIVGAGCSKDDKLFRKINVPVATPQEAADATNIINFRNKITALEAEKSNLIAAHATALQTEKESFTTNLAALQIEKESLATNLATLKTEISATKVAADLQNKKFAAQIAAIQESLKLSSATATVSATATATAQASVTTPTVGINIPATSGIMTVDNNARIATPGSGTVVQFGTNGMVGGVPCLFNNESTVDRTVTVANSEGYKYTFTVAGSMMETINLLPGKYSYNWTIGKDPATYPTTGQEVTFSVDSKPVHAFRTLGKTFHGGLKFRGEQ